MQGGCVDRKFKIKYIIVNIPTSRYVNGIWILFLGVCLMLVRIGPGRPEVFQASVAHARQSVEFQTGSFKKSTPAKFIYSVVSAS